MVELMMYEEQSSSGSGFRARDASPDSVIFTLESNFSLFSSASASVDRCSFASDVHDHDSTSEISLNLAGHEGECSSGPDPDPNPNKATLHTHSRLSRKSHKAKVQKEGTDGDVEDDKQFLDSARSSFSLALKECQERRSRSDAPLRKFDRQRPASFDLNNATASSPRMGGVKKSSMVLRKNSAFPSPGTPNYLHAGGGLQKGWSSERVPLQSAGRRRNTGAVAFLPFNNNGRTLPSKWEDAERWILSPVSGDGIPRFSRPPQRRPKSKSGPIGAPGVSYHSLYSPAMPMFEGGNMGNLMVGSPFSAGVIGVESLTRQNSVYHGGAFSVGVEACMGRSASVHGCSEHLNQPPTTVSQDEKLEGVKDAATDIFRDISRRDMATQMSPDGSDCSSPTGRLSFTIPPSATSGLDLQSARGSKLGVKDVQVDEQVTLTRRSKKNKYRIPGKGSGGSEDWRKKDRDTRTSAWDMSDTKNISKVKREEAKITAWENLQKAKAEAAIRKLEMKLEKKRSSSMDKIMKKLRSAQKRAQEMRSSMLANESHQIARTSHKAVVFPRGTRQMSSFSGCFTCHAF